MNKPAPSIMRCALPLLLGFALHEGCAAQDAPRLEIRKVPAGLAVYRAGQAQPLLVQHCMPDSRPYIRMPVGEGAFAINSEGRKNQDAEQQKARWVCVSTPIKDRDNNGNICIMDHRQNAGHPVPWRVDSQFGVAPSRCILGDWHLAKGATETNRYRVRIFTGKPDAAALDASWNAFVK